MASTYPAAHLLSLPVELREAIYDFIAENQPILHHKDISGAIHLSAAHTQPLALLQTHPLLHDEALAYFHRTQSVTLHVDAFAYARLRNPNLFAVALQNNHYIQRARALELRYVLNAHVEFLVQAAKDVVSVLLLPTCNVKRVSITWTEAVQNVLQRTWRPWVYKSPALEPLWDLLDHVEVTCGGVINAPPATAGLQDIGFRRSMGMIFRYKALGDEARPP